MWTSVLGKDWTVDTAHLDLNTSLVDILATICSWRLVHGDYSPRQGGLNIRTDYAQPT
jgi:hypothetical protein